MIYFLGSNKNLRDFLWREKMREMNDPLLVYFSAKSTLYGNLKMMVKDRCLMSVEKEHLLSTYWIQCDKVVNCGSNENLENGIHFNEYAPLDFYTSEAVRSYTGCISTAVSQVIYYHLMKTENRFRLILLTEKMILL